MAVVVAGGAVMLITASLDEFPLCLMMVYDQRGAAVKSYTVIAIALKRSAGLAWLLLLVFLLPMLFPLLLW